MSFAEEFLIEKEKYIEKMKFIENLKSQVLQIQISFIFTLFFLKKKNIDRWVSAEKQNQGKIWEKRENRNSEPFKWGI